VENLLTPATRKKSGVRPPAADRISGICVAAAPRTMCLLLVASPIEYFVVWSGAYQPVL
jgi:hypothetical protein